MNKLLEKNINTWFLKKHVGGETGMHTSIPNPSSSVVTTASTKLTGVSASLDCFCAPGIVCRGE